MSSIRDYTSAGGNSMRLIKPKKKGIMSIIFSRFFIFLIFMLLQISVLFIVAAYTKEHVEHYLIIERIFAFIMIVYLFSNSMDSSAKLTWMMIISLIPVAGAGILFFTQANLGNRYVRREVARQISDTKDALMQPPGVLKELHDDGSHTDDLLRYLNRSGCFPAYSDTDVTYFPSGEAKFEALLAELEKAEQYIFMEYFIIEEGYMWGCILDVLTRKASEGVTVRVLYDGMCELTTLTPDYFRRLKAVGIDARPFSPILPLISSHYNYRDHRKILVIDGKTAFNGGVNLADEYINRKKRFGHWKDTAVMLKGSAAGSFALMFLQMWNIGKQDPDYSVYLPEQKNSLVTEEGASAECGNNEPADTADMAGNTEEQDDVPESADIADMAVRAEDPAPETGAASRGFKGYVVPYCDCPLDDDKVGESVYMDILNRAGTYVHIMTPYLILDGQLEMSLMYAAQRGVDVKIILPGIPDKKMAYSLAKSHYSRLTAAGVKIYEYTPGFVHAKVFVSDDIKAVVGTINLDYRSLYHHFECATYMYRTECVADIERDFRETLKQCRRVTPESIKGEELFYKVAGGIMKFVAPLM